MTGIMIATTPSNPKIREKMTMDYKILNYDQSCVCFDDYETGKSRSVIVSRNTGRVMAYGPPKSVSIETFKDRYPEFEDHMPGDVYITEIVEGTMINLFFDRERNTWEIATKSAVGGHYWYYRQHYGTNVGSNQYTFRQMFMEAVGESALSDLNDSYLVQDLDKNMSYSFVLQHPANHIVLDIYVPKTYLVAIYEINYCENTVRHVPLFEYYQNHAVLIHKYQYGVFYLPTVYNSLLLCDSNKMRYSDLDTPNVMTYFPVGYMLIHSQTGDRVTVKSENYERLKAIRGNHPNLQYQYLAIMRSGKVADFLYYFPVYKKMFDQFYEQMSDYVKSVHKLYLEVYVKKNRQILENVSKMTRLHLQTLHFQKHILDKQVVTRSLVFEWFLKTMEPGQLLYLLRGKPHGYPIIWSNHDKPRTIYSTPACIALNEPCSHRS